MRCLALLGRIVLLGHALLTASVAAKKPPSIWETGKTGERGATIEAKMGMFTTTLVAVATLGKDSDIVDPDGKKFMIHADTASARELSAPMARAELQKYFFNGGYRIMVIFIGLRSDPNRATPSGLAEKSEEFIGAIKEVEKTWGQREEGGCHINYRTVAAQSTQSVKITENNRLELDRAERHWGSCAVDMSGKSRGRKQRSN